MYIWVVRTWMSFSRILIIYWLGISFLTGISVYGGLLAYATYYGCDPIKRKVPNSTILYKWLFLFFIFCLGHCFYRIVNLWIYLIFYFLYDFPVWLNHQKPHPLPNPPPWLVSYFSFRAICFQLVSRADQIFPYYVLDKTGYIPALPGLFVAGVFSAALRSLFIYMSCILNVEVLKI